MNLKMCSTRGLFLLTALAVMGLSINAFAQNEFLYTNTTTSVSGFSISSNGSLAEIQGSPFLKPGQPGGAPPDEGIAISPAGNFLYVPSGDSGIISGFAINPVTGFLSPVPGSPFSTGMTFSAINLAITPDGRFLYSGHYPQGKVTGFAIGSDGALTPLPGPPKSVFLPTFLKVTPSGRFLVVSGFDALWTYQIAFDGGLIDAPGSPLGLPDDVATPFSMDINCASNLLFVGGVMPHDPLDGIFSIANNGTLTRLPLPSMPLSGFLLSQVILLSPDGRFLFATNPNFGQNGIVSSYRLAPNGDLSVVPGSPFFVGLNSQDRTPNDLGTNLAGTLLFSANDDATISAFHIDTSTGVLTPVDGSPFPNHGGFGVRIAMFPARRLSGQCANAFDICLQDSNTGDLFQFNSMTGSYLFTRCRDKFMLSGTGVVSNGNSIATLNDTKPDRRISAGFLMGQRTGTATIYLTLGPGIYQRVAINSTNPNSTCACGS